MTETTSILQVRRYGPGELHIATASGLTRITTPVMLALPDRLQSLRSAGPQTLAADELAELLTLTPEIALIGTSAGTWLPSARERSVFLERRIGLEVMALGPACRTFNVLAQEGRRVVALLFP